MTPIDQLENKINTLLEAQTDSNAFLLVRNNALQSKLKEVLRIKR